MAGQVSILPQNKDTQDKNLRGKGKVIPGLNYCN
jgi:hypothetical protein